MLAQPMALVLAMPNPAMRKSRSMPYSERAPLIWASLAPTVVRLMSSLEIIAAAMMIMPMRPITMPTINSMRERPDWARRVAAGVGSDCMLMARASWWRC